MKRVWWKLSILMMFVIIISPNLNPLVFETSGKISIDHHALRIPDYMTDWRVNNNDSNQDTVTYVPDFQQKRIIIIESNNTQADCGRDGPMDSAWPMFGHDVIHTCRSSYSTENNTGAEIWRVRGDETGSVWGSALIDTNGLIYFGTMGADGSLYALYPNGTRKWKFSATDIIWGTPAISEEGIIYFTTWGRYFFAVNPDGTERWRFNTGSISTSSVTIGEDGTLYFGADDYNIFAVNQNGTEKWRYTTGFNVNGAPAIGQDGTIYIGSGDHYFYALNPNGILRWQFATGGEIKGSASIAPDGTIYVPSFGGYFYALYPNGTMKWKASTGGIVASAGVALAQDGTIYVGTEILRAYYPNGTLRWSVDVQGDIFGTVPAVSADGTIYVSAGDSLVAVNPDGTERWRKTLSNEQIRSSPSIGENDRIYVGSSYRDYGYLHVFGIGPLRAEAGGPYQGTALCPITLTGLAFGGTLPYQYLWDFGDGNSSTEINPAHTYTIAGNYTAVFTITDSDGNSSSDNTTVTIDYPLPTLTITKPTNGFYIADKQIFTFPFPFILGKITIQVTVEDHYDIDQVIICIRDDVVYTGTTPPYEWTWTQRNFRLKDNIYAIAYDVKGRYAEQRIQVTKLF
ncbi:MAG: PQQ-binding-like beta-propeller repeat protein [Candidatus Thermoplasmatota archaeon]